MINNFQRFVSLAVSLDVNGHRGTGFLFCHQGNFLLITARHVLFGEKNGTFSRYGNDITIRYPNIKKLETSSNHLYVVLNDDNCLYDQNFDIGVIYLGQYTLHDNNTKLAPEFSEFVTAPDFGANQPLVHGSADFKKLSDLKLGNELFVLGYPTSLGVDDYLDYFDIDLPVVRRGIISHINFSKSYIIIDCSVFAGNSGGPVMLNQYNNRPDYILIGIVSKYVPYRQKFIIPNENIHNVKFINSGYAVVIPIENILNFLERRLPRKNKIINANDLGDFS